MLRAMGDGKRDEVDESHVLRETMAALDLPRRGLGKFFAHNRAFCEAHGGRRVYGELLALLDRCDDVLRMDGS
jgi:hypothetical protein